MGWQNAPSRSSAVAVMAPALACLAVTLDGDVPHQTASQVRKVFKKKSVAMLPEKHPSDPRADAKYQELNTAFVQVNK